MPSARTAMSGVQHEISHGGHRAVITEVGATLREYEFEGRAVIDGFGSDEICHDGRGQVLAPWPNRLDEGRYEFDGRAGRAALDEPANKNAIHGLVRWRDWECRSESPEAVTLRCVLNPQPAYPWRLSLTVEYRVGPRGLSVEATAVNESATVAPFGIGFHPYITVGTPTIDQARLTLRAGRRLVADGRGLPTGAAEVAGSDFDFSRPRPIASTQLDTAFFDLQRDETGLATVDLDIPAGLQRTLWIDEHFPYLMAYTADSVQGDPRTAIALEPMSCAPNAFRSGEGLVSLEPDASWIGRWGITPA